MDKSGSSADTRSTAKGMDKWKAVVAKINQIINLIGVWLFRLRKIVMAAPVVYYALKLAAYNTEHLPEQVGLNLQASGEFATTIARSLAVSGPLGLTIGCLVLMLFSKKAMYPWAVSIFTLALPLLLLFSNTYPA